MSNSEIKVRKIEAGKRVGLGEPKNKVAEALGVTRACIHLWKDDADFVQSMNDAREAYETFKNFYLKGISAAAV